MIMKSKYLLLISAIFIALLSMYVSVLRADESTIRVYSERQPFLIEPLINEYEKISGNKIEWIFSKKGFTKNHFRKRKSYCRHFFIQILQD